MDWFLYNIGLRHERVKMKKSGIIIPPAEIIDKQLKHLNSKNSALRKSYKADPPKISKHGGFQGGKGNAKGAGRPLSYPTSADEELLCWTLIMNDHHLPVSILALKQNKIANTASQP